MEMMKASEQAVQQLHISLLVLDTEINSALHELNLSYCQLIAHCTFKKKKKKKVPY